MYTNAYKAIHKVKPQCKRDGILGDVPQNILSYITN